MNHLYLHYSIIESSTSQHFTAKGKGSNPETRHQENESTLRVAQGEDRRAFLVHVSIFRCLVQLISGLALPLSSLTSDSRLC